MTKDVVKKYSNGEINIVWKPNLCIHSENCWRGLPSVFSPKDRPWINPDSASTAEIIAQVGKCPSGALSIEKAGEPESVSVDDTKVQIEAATNGPLLVKGKVRISDGQEVLYEGESVALCRCGGSSRKPFCDGTHKKIGFKG